MKIKYLKIAVIILLLIISCSVEEKLNEKEIKIEKEVDYLLKENNHVVYFSRIENVHIYDNLHISILDKGKKIYVVDSNFTIIKMYDIEKDSPYILKGKIKYHKVFKQDILFIDEEFGYLKILEHNNYKTKKLKIPYKENVINTEGKNFIGRPTSFEILNDSTIILAFSVYSISKKNVSNNVAAVINLNKPNYSRFIEISNDLIGNPVGVYDESFVSYNQGLIYITFRISPKILIFDNNLRLIQESSFKTDKDFYFFPKIIDKDKIQYIIMNCGPIYFDNSYSYHTINRGPDEDFLLIKYDSLFNEVHRYYLKRDAIERDITFLDFSVIKFRDKYLLWNWPSPKIIFAKVDK
jgi:hypothetical protein